MRATSRRTWATVIAITIAVLVVLRLMSPSTDASVPTTVGSDGEHRVGRDGEHDVAGSSSSVEPERIPANPASPRMQCIDFETGVGIAGARVGEQGEVVTTGASGEFSPPTNEWTRYAADGYGIGLINLALADQQRVQYRLRKSWTVAIRVVSAPNRSGELTLRLDRQGSDPAGVNQSRTHILAIRENQDVAVSLVGGRWRASVGDGTALVPWEFEVIASSAISLLLADRSTDTIVGRLVDSAGHPCAGVDVRLSGSEVAAASTDQGGYFCIREPSRNAPGGIVYIDVALDSLSWEPIFRQGPFQKGVDETVIRLSPLQSKVLEISIDAVAQSDWSASVHSKGGESVASIVAQHGRGQLPRVIDPSGFLTIRVSRLATPLLVNVGDLLPEVVDHGVVVYRVKLAGVDLEVAPVDSVSGALVAGARVEVVDSPGGEDAARVRNAGVGHISGLPPTQSVATAWSDSKGVASFRGVFGCNLLLCVTAPGYQDSYVSVQRSGRTLVSLVRHGRLSGQVKLPPECSDWLAEVSFAPVKTHAYHQERLATVGRERYAVEDLPFGTYVVSVRVGRQPWDMVAVRHGDIEFAGQSSYDIDMAALRFASVAVTSDPHSSLKLRGDNQVSLIADSGFSVALRWQGDSFGPVKVLPGKYWAMASAQSPDTGETVVAWLRIDVDSHDAPQTFAMAFTLASVEVCVVDDARRPVVAAWYDVPGYGMRRTNRQGIIVLPSPMPAGATIHRLAANSSRPGWLYAGKPIQLEAAGANRLLAIDIY